MEELKCLENSREFTATDGGVGHYYGLINCARGYGNGQRVGNTIRVHRLELSYLAMNFNDATAARPCSLRAMLFVDRQAQGFTDADLFAVTTSGHFMMVSPIVYTELDRFVPVDNWLCHFSSDYGGSALGVDRPIYYTRTVNTDFLVAFNGNTGTSTDVCMNNMWAMFVNSRATPDNVRVFWNVRVFYTDE